ncbi:MAG TPA: response regulator [Casimicrobiaceae bacterium]|nr:response regulator [Casimicrobiaceae bacterium]
MTESSEATGGREVAQREASAERAPILVVDDRPDKLLALSSVLEELGQDIVTAASGEEALKHVLAQEFAVILLDVNMPGLDGLETAALIRKRRKSAHTPIIFITSDFGDDAHSRRGYSLGAVDYIASPVVPEILRAKVRVFVELFLLARQAAHQAQQQLALAQERAGREAAERSAQRLAFLARASGALAASLDVQATAREIGCVVVPHLCDVALLTFTARDDQPQSTHHITHVGSDGDVTSRPLGETIDASLLSMIDRVAATGVLQELLDGKADDTIALPDHREAHSIVVMPLNVRGHAIAVLTLAMTGYRRFDADAISVGVDVAARSSAALDNAFLHQRIQESDQRKDEFLAMLAHELRNPLAPIANAVHVLKAAGSGDETVSWARDLIGRQLKQLTRLVDDLLDLSRITRDKIELKLETLHVADLVTAAVETSRPLIDAQQHTLNVSLPEAPVTVRGDFARVTQIFGNLINNAAKYTDPGGTIDVELARDGDHAVFRVRDTGVGIPAHALATVFEPFMQLDRTLDRSQGGLGIGLTLVRKLVEMQGGSVAAHSAGSGKGSEFVVRLPLVRAPGVGSAVTAGSSAIANDTVGAPLTVLVVDDNNDVAESTAILLRFAGCNVHVAGDGKTALAALDALRPDALLLDIGLPGMDGYQVAARVRERPEFQRTLIVAVSGYGQEEYQARSREAGVDHHLVKPVDAATVMKLLSGHSRRRDATSDTASTLPH